MSFSAITQALNPSTSLSTCNGCRYSVASGTLDGAYESYGQHALSGAGSWAATSVHYAGSDEQWVLAVSCFSDFGGTEESCTQAPSDISICSQGDKCAHPCAITSVQQQTNGNPPGSVFDAVYCNTQPAGNWNVDYAGASAGTCGDIFGSCSVTTEELLRQGSWPSTTYYMPWSCMSYGSSGRTTISDVDTRAKQWLTSHGYATRVWGPSLWNSPSPGYYCATAAGAVVQPGAQMPGNASTWWQYGYVDGDEMTVAANEGPALELARLTALVPAGYALQSGYHVCPAAQVTSSSTKAPYQANLVCSATGNAVYAFTPAMLANLAQQIAGKTESQAQALLAATTGVDGSKPITISLTSSTGGESTLPTDPSKITITVSNP